MGTKTNEVVDIMAEKGGMRLGVCSEIVVKGQRHDENALIYLKTRKDTAPTKASASKTDGLRFYRVSTLSPQATKAPTFNVKGQVGGCISRKGPLLLRGQQQW